MKVYRYPEQSQFDKSSPTDEVDLSSNRYSYFHSPESYHISFDINSPDARERRSALKVEISSQDLLCLLEQGLYKGLTSDEVSSIINILSKHLVEENNKLKKKNDELQDKINKFREISA